MSSTSYRYYRLDEGHRLYGAEHFDAASDEDAIARIRDDHPDSVCELWREKRLIARLAPSGSQA